jgi:hypothetical protein
MGLKASMILVKPLPDITDSELLQKLGFGYFDYVGETTLEDCIYPSDKSVSIGRYNGCLIICDDYLLTTSLESTKTPQNLCSDEQILTELFPQSEILSIACHSVTNYHLYALAKGTARIRYKSLSADTPLVEAGNRIEEEMEIYAGSKIINGIRLFKADLDDEQTYEYTEDQLMEDFAFGVAKRHLGVKISNFEDEELMFDTSFRKYKKGAAAVRGNAGKHAEERTADEGTGLKKPWWKVW